MEIHNYDFDRKVIQADKPVLLMFWGSWCPSCKQADILFNVLKGTVETVDFFKMNVDRNPSVAISYDVMGTPCFVLFKDGREIDRLVGSQSKNNLMEMLDGVC